MIRSAHVDTFARDNLPARGQWPEFLFKLPELNYPDRLNCVSAFVDDWVAAGEGARDCLISPTERLILCRSGRAGKSHRQRAYARSRRRAGQSRAVARAEQPDDGGRLFCRHQSRRRRGRDHAAAAGEGNRIPADQGRNPAGAVRHSAGRRNGEGAFARARARAYRLLGLRRRRQPRSDDEKGRLRALRGVRHGERRCLPDRLYVGYHRRTQGHDAFSPRHARHLRHVRKIRAARRPR